MFIVHAVLRSSLLHVWAERPPAAEAPPAPRHPGDGGAAALLELATHTGLSLAEGSLTDQTAWLPTRLGRPLPSAPLLGERPDDGDAAPLRPWLVTTAPLPWADATELLRRTSEASVLTPGVVAGPSLAFHAAVLRFAAGLVVRHRYLPGLTLDGEGPRALWQTLLAGPDTARLEALARAMPPSARCVTDPDTEAAPAPSALAATADAVSAAVDALVRLAQPPPARPVVGHPSVHDAWLHALTGADPTLAADETEVARLADELTRWRRPLDLAAASPFRLVLRLEEPEGDLWYLRYLLQARDDPSLVVEAAESWEPRGTTARLFRSRGLSAPELLLASLGRAAACFPPLEAGLEAGRPAGQALDLHDAWAFLAEAAPELEELGFVVQVPAWWTGRGARSRLALRGSASGGGDLRAPGGLLGLDEVVDVDWEVVLGDETLTEAELEELARRKEPLVRLRGSWVEIRSRDIKAALDFLRNHRDGGVKVRDVVGLALGTIRQIDGLPFAGVAATGLVGDLLSKLEGDRGFETLPPPATFQGTLRPYQLRGYSWLAFLRRTGFGACLADDMGLGKTVQALALFAADRLAGERRSVLLVCPTSVVNTWRREAARFTPDLPVVVHHGADRKKGGAFLDDLPPGAMVVTSYALLQRDLGFLNRVSWAGVVLDEAQNVKNPDTKQSRAARSLKADYRFALTGTPIENGVGDLWSIMEFLNPGLLGGRAGFRRDFLVPIQAFRDADATKRLHRLVAPFVLRRLKTDGDIISDLPEKNEMKVYCSLTQEQASLYRAVLADVDATLADATGLRRRGLILATLGRLKQICNHPAHFLGDGSPLPGRSGKLDRLTTMLETALAVGDRVLVFTQYAAMGTLLQGTLQETFGREVLFLHGAVPRHRRDEMVDRFQREDGPSIFVLSLRAGGTGLTLTRATHVVHYDRWWNPAVEDQATDRAYRIGQTRNVQVHKFVCAGTLEEKVDELLERKLAVANDVVASGEEWLTSLSDDELRSVLALHAEAVAE